ncbi:MAG: hypothetical protein VYD90_18840 [Pseudomonadota bacterium]|nr:hypothetical protein [Pseudomonadota bacterium]
MQNTFIATSDGYSAPVTLIARSLDEAFQLLHMWRETHAPELVEANALIAQLGDRDLRGQPELASIAASGLLGIAWWNEDDRRWAVGAPDGPALGAITPPAPSVKCFVLGDANATHVFAKTRSHARALLTALGHTDGTTSHEDDGLTEMSPWLFHASLVTLREEMFEGKCGVGVLGDDDYWHIVPAADAT